MKRTWLKWTLSAVAAVMLAYSAPVMAEEAAHGSTDAAHGAEKPSLTRGFDAGGVTAVTTLLVFGGLLVILGKFAWGPVLSGLKNREDGIRKDIAEAEAARHKAETALKDYQTQLAKAQDEIRALLDKAQADGQALATRIKMTAQQEAEEAKERATKDIESAHKAAIADIHSQAANISTSIAEKILRRNLNVDDQRGLVNSALEQLSKVN